MWLLVAVSLEFSIFIVRFAENNYSFQREFNGMCNEIKT